MSRFVRQMVSEKVDLVATDEGAGYQKLYQAFPHKTVDHKALEYVRGEVHTNNIESFWSLLETWSHRHVPQRQQEVSAALSCGVPVPPQQPQESRHFRRGDSGGLMLKRTDWRSLQWTGSDASEPIQLELPFPSARPWIWIEPQLVLVFDARHALFRPR